MLRKVLGKLSVGMVVTNALRLVLVIGFIFAFQNSRSLAMAFTVIAFTATFIPKALERLDIETGSEMHVVILLIIYGSLFLGEVRGFFAELWWWAILLKGVAGLALGFVGLTIVLSLEDQELLDASPFMVIMLSFAISFTLGAGWEIMEFGMDKMFGFSLQTIGSGVVAHDLIINGLAALTVSVGGYVYKRRGIGNPVSGLLVKMMKSNPLLFRSHKKLTSHTERIKGLIEKGEGPKLEFKSSIRTNLYTNAIDKSIENSILKTMAAYLNSDGGNILVGVSDKGDVVGVEKDNFPSDDKLKLHLNNMVKEYIGPQFMTFIKYEIFNMEGKKIVMIECHPSPRRVFLKENGQEEFYMRQGPSSMRLSGNALLDYVSHRFP